jgi:hypothetical protein
MGCISQDENHLESPGTPSCDSLQTSYARQWRNPAAVEELIAYLEKRRAYIPDYQQRQRAGLWIASTRVKKYNDWAVSARCKNRGMSWSPQGVLALAALEAARRNGELDAWRRDRALPEHRLPVPVRKAA